jgi:hypothetical protein
LPAVQARSDAKTTATRWYSAIAFLADKLPDVNAFFVADNDTDVTSDAHADKFSGDKNRCCK